MRLRFCNAFPYAALVLATAAAADAQPPNLTVVRELRIDGVAANLLTPRWILVGRDGRIAVDQQQDRTVLFFDANGRSIGRFGRRGEGPGEFQFIVTAGWVGDSLWAHDLTAQRTTVITPTFNLARVIPDVGVKPAPGQESRHPTSASSDRRALYPDGSSLVTVVNFTGAKPPGFDSIGSRVYRTARDGVIRNQVIHLNHPNGSVRVPAGGRFIQQGTPLYARPISKVSDRGNRIAILTCMYDGPQSKTMRLVMLGAAADTVYARDFPFTAEAIPRSVADSAFESAIAGVKSISAFVGADDAARLINAVRAEMRIPPFYPPYTNLLISDDGAAWIELRSPATGPTSFLLLDARGTVVGTVALPARTKALTVSATHVWGIELDQDDVPSVVRYRVAGR